MTIQVLQSPPISCAITMPSPHNDVPHLQQTLLITTPNPNPNICLSSSVDVHIQQEQEQEQEDGVDREEEEEDREGDQLSLLAHLVTVFRKSLIVVGGCSSISSEGDNRVLRSSNMEIGSPRNVRHVAHVTFDRFNGFLGLPVEFEPEVPRRPPSASAKVFGVSTDSMQLSFDSRGNSVPTILLMMQRRLYTQGGLQAEGIFRINADNSQEEYVREQLNSGVVPDGIDVHCLAGLIKAWFRELPKGILDSLSPEQVMQSQTEEECAQLVRLLPPIEAALLDWGINLMADVAQHEHLNKMNARNVAMVFAPNMTQMLDPLTALMFAVQVMNFLKTLIIKTLREREDSIVEKAPAFSVEPFDKNGHDSSSQPFLDEAKESKEEEEHVFAVEAPASERPSPVSTTQDDSATESRMPNFLISIENIIPGGNGISVDNCHYEVSAQENSLAYGLGENDVMNCAYEGAQNNICKTKTVQSSRNNNIKKGSKKVNERPVVRAAGFVQKSKGTGVVSRISSRSDRTESWR